MSIEHAILGIISWYPATGYDIKTEFDHGGAGLVWGLGFGSIYPKLRELEEEGLVAVLEEETDGRSRKRYELTGKGWEELSRWLAEQPAYPLPWRDELLLKIGFWGAARPEDRATLVEHLEARRARSLELLQYLKEWPQNGYSMIDEYGMLVLKYGQAHLEAELAWIDRAITQLSGSPRPPVQDPRGLVPAQQRRRLLALRGEEQRR